MRTFSFCGTIEYMSPELIKGGNEGHDFSVDWWSVGVLTYELLTGASPFTVDGERNSQADISKRILKNQPPIPDHLSSQARDFICRLLTKEPLNRLGGGQGNANQLKRHPFLASINWNLLAQRRVRAPFKPKIKHELDVSNFAEEFTSMAPHMLVCAASNHANGSEIQDDDDDDFFESDDDDGDGDDDEAKDHGTREAQQDNNEDGDADGSVAPTHGPVIHASSHLNARDVVNSSDTSINELILKHQRQFEIFSLLTPSENQLSFDMLAKQHENSQLINCSNNIIRLANSNIDIDLMNAIQRSNESHIAKSSRPAQHYQLYNGKNLNKLFKGYSYINPEAIAWFKEQDRKQLTRQRLPRVKASMGGLSEQQHHISQQLHSFCPKISKNSSRGVKAIPIESISPIFNEDFSDIDLIQTDNYDKIHLTNGARNNSSRVAFTIGDGEDLSTVLRFAGEVSEPERLIAVRRKPSIELFYERHANNQNLLPAFLNPSNTAQKRLKLASIPFDSNCEFFRCYHLAHPLNSKRELIGEGSYSVCKRCTHRETGKEYAVKIMARSPRADREIDMLMRCQGHPNIVRLFDVFHDQHNSYLVMEYLKGGELLNRIRGATAGSAQVSQRKRARSKDIKSLGPISELEACEIFKSLLSTVNYLHSQRIVHRDLKPENLLFNDSSLTSQLKLIDFGFARELPEKGSLMKSPCVTFNYCAPEVLNQVVKRAPSQNIKSAHDDGYDESCDLWSLGVILYSMLSGGRLPNAIAEAKHIKPQMTERSFSSEIDFDGPGWSCISEAPKKIIRGLLCLDPTKRMTMRQVLEHEWLNADRSKLKKAKAQLQLQPQVDLAGAPPKVCQKSITMTLRKRTVKTTRSYEPPTFEPISPKKAPKRSLDQQAASGRGQKRAKCQTSPSSNSTECCDWLSRFVQMEQPNKDSLRITFRALHRDDQPKSMAKAVLDSALSNPPSTAKVKLQGCMGMRGYGTETNETSTGVDRDSFQRFPLDDPATSSRNPNGLVILDDLVTFSGAKPKRQVKRLKLLHQHDRISAGSTGTTIGTISSDSMN